MADAFAWGMADRLPALSAREPALVRLKGFFDLVAVAQAVPELPRRPEQFADQWARLPTGTADQVRDVPPLRVRGLLERSDGATEAILISDGIELQTQIKCRNRFWFTAGQVRFADADGIVMIEKLPIMLRTEEQMSQADGQLGERDAQSTEKRPIVHSEQEQARHGCRRP